MGVASAAAGVGSAAIGAHAAGKAANAQEAAANHAADLQHQDAQAALKFQQDQWNTQQQNLAPWLNTGKDALSQLWSMYQGGQFGNFTDKFTAPTMQDAQNDPGYAFGLQQGEGAIQNSAAARGKLFSGNTSEALAKFGNDYASTKYNDVYQRALGQFQQNYGIFENNQTNNFNRLAALSGVGQQAATTLGQEGAAASNNVSNTLLTSGAQIGQNINNAGAARASGYAANGNIWGSVFGGLGNLGGLLALQGGGRDQYGAPNPYGIGAGNYPS